MMDARPIRTLLQGMNASFRALDEDGLVRLVEAIQQAEEERPGQGRIIICKLINDAWHLPTVASELYEGYGLIEILAR